MRRSGIDRIGLVLAAALGGCGGGSGGATAAPDPNPLAEARIGPEGGSFAVASGPHAGVALSVPAGAVAVATRFTIRLMSEHPQVPSLFPIYRFEPSDQDFSAAPLVVTVRAGGALADPGAAMPPVLFRQHDVDAPWHVAIDSTVHDGLVSAPLARLGLVLAWDGNLHRLFTQDRALLDPAEPQRAELLAGVPMTIANGSWSVSVGRGDLASFWSSPASDNVLIVHGLLGSPLDYIGSDDLVAQLSPAVRNVVLFSYPSAPGSAVAANALFDEIVRHRHPGFGCNIVAHSLGGLVARYLLEQSAADPTRAGYAEGDQPLGDQVANLVLLGVPNAGAAFAEGLIATLVPQIAANELDRVQAAFDLSEQPGSFTAMLNEAYVDNPTRYHFVCGDLGNGSDGVVSIASVLALPLGPGDTVRSFPVGHVELHAAAGSSGIATLIDMLIGQ